MEMISIHRSEPESATWRDDLAWMCSQYLEAISEEISQSEGRRWRRADPGRSHEISEALSKILVCPESGCLLIASHGPERMGYFLGMTKDCIAESPSVVGYINGLYVRPPYRSQGIGRRLLRAGYEWFRSQGLRLVELYTAVENDSGKSFWSQQGFIATEVVMMKEI